MRKRLAGMAAALLAAVLFLTFDVNALSARSAIMLDSQTGRVLFEQQADRQSLIASTTKMMTALVVCEQCNVLDRVKIPKEAVGIEGSSMYLKEGEVLTIQELLYGLMLHSGNDAAVALAIYCAGTVEGFADLMNDKARVLSLEHTHFVNPHGLDAPGHYSTARDLAALAAYAMKNPIFLKTVSTKTVKIGERNLRNHNKLLWQYEGAEGIKTGFTKAAGRILVSSAQRNDRRLIVVTINAPNDWNDHIALYNQGFAQYSQRTILLKGDYLTTTSVIGGTQQEVSLYAAEDFSYALTEEERSRIQFRGREFVFAPISSGQPADDVYVLLNGDPVGKVSAVYGTTIEQTKPEESSFIERIIGGM